MSRKRFFKKPVNRFASTILILGVGFMLNACTGLPDQGPGRLAIEKSSTANNTSGFVLIDINRSVASILMNEPTGSLKLLFGKGRPTNTDRIGPGDVLNVTIWESDPNGLFSKGSAADPGTGANTGRVTGIEVDRRGFIRFPYVGRIRASGRSTSALSEVIRAKLSEQTTTPQVHIERVSKKANVVTVVGGVKQPGIYPLGTTNSDILDILAAAGGSNYPSYETKVSLTRGSKTAAVFLDRMISNSRENIYVSPHDEISIERSPRYFLAFGAVANKGQVQFGQPKLTVLEALAKAQGLDHTLADPTGVFLFRFETRKTVKDLGYIGQVTTTGSLIPVIYRFNLQDPSQYFFAKAIQIQHQDAIFAANSSVVQLEKFLKILNGTVEMGTSIVKVAK